jgi:hypothetical protein
LLALADLVVFLQKVDSKILMTFDTWTSLVGDPFIGITAHYITAPDTNPQQWELKNEQLAFTPLVGDHSGANIGSILVETLNTYGIHAKVQYNIFSIDGQADGLT